MDEAVASARGWMQVLAWPAGRPLDPRLGRWRSAGGRLPAAIKRALDPGNVFNPGFVPVAGAEAA
jgi:FAD/FMN-containing dehydrogenase